MPILTLSLDHADRPIISLYVGLNLAEIEYRREIGEPVLTPLPLRALVDSGASRTLIVETFLRDLGLVPVGETEFNTASTGLRTVSTREYAVELTLNEDTAGSLATNLRVVAAENLSGLGVDALLGRDVLDRCLLVYNGPRRQFTISF